MIAKFCLNPALRPPRLWSVATRRQASDSASPNAEKVSASRLDRVAETRQVNTSRTRYGLFGLEPSLNHLIIKCLRIFTHRTLQTSNHLAFVHLHDPRKEDALSIQTIYKCDRCGAEQSTAEQFWTVGVVARHGHDQPNRWVTSTDGKEMQVCRPCLEAMGIYTKKQMNQPDAPPIQTMEDLIREIVRQEIPQA